MVTVPAWGIGSDKELRLLLPETYDNYANVVVIVRCQGCPARVEAMYSVEVLEGYNSAEIENNISHPVTGVLHDAVLIRITRDVSADFIQGFKYAEIRLMATDTDWPDDERHTIRRQYFAYYYENKVHSGI